MFTTNFQQPTIRQLDTDAFLCMIKNYSKESKFFSEYNAIGKTSIAKAFMRTYITDNKVDKEGLLIMEKLLCTHLPTSIMWIFPDSTGLEQDGNDGIIYSVSEDGRDPKV